jgi:hypothetical protein
MIPKLIFAVDPDYDWRMLQAMRQRLPVQFKKLRSKKEFMAIYGKATAALRATASMYQLAWDKVGDYFFKRAETIVHHPWRFAKYSCVVSLIHRGISSWGGNKIARIWSENPYTQRKITAHELLITYLWDYLDKHGYRDLSSTHKWAFCEISAWAITGLDRQLVNKAWPWISEDERWSLTHNYPQLVTIQKRARPLYEGRIDFGTYAKKLVTLIQRQVELAPPR